LIIGRNPSFIAQYREGFPFYPLTWRDSVKTILLKLHAATGS
jgi:hypothetical protein